MMRGLPLMLSLVLIAGCSLTAPLPPEPKRELLQQLPADLPRLSPGPAVLLVTETEAEPLLDTTRMAYTSATYELGYFNDHEWAEKPARMIQTLLTSALRQTGRFRDVTAPPEFTRYDFALHSRLLTLTQDYTAKKPVVHVALRVQLVSRGAGLVASHDFAADMPISAPGARGGVVAANEAVARLIDEAVRFVTARAEPP